MAQTPAAAVGQAPTTAAMDAVDAAPEAPMICQAGRSEQEVADEILLRSGRGLLWLVGPGSADPEAAAAALRQGVAQVRAARALADCLLLHHDAGFDPTQRQGFEQFERWLSAHVGPEHAPTLLAAGAAYFASLLGSSDGIDAMLDVSTARLLLERACAADPAQADRLGPLILGAYECFVPKVFGGIPEHGLRRLQEAYSHEGSLRLAMKVAAAELCAVALQDRLLFHRLLQEVLRARTGLSPFDMMAKVRAQSVLAQEANLFLEPP